MASAASQEIDQTALGPRARSLVRGEKGRFSKGPRSYEWLAGQPIVRDWIDQYVSRETREKKLYQLEKVILASRLRGPTEFLALPDREIKSIVRRVTNWYLQQGKGVWAKQLTITLKGFLEAQDRDLEFRRSERIRTPARKKISIEHVPTKAEVYKMAENSGSPKAKAIILSLFQSGVRVSCLCNWSFSLVSSQIYPEIHRPVKVRVTPNLDTKLSLYGLPYYITGLQEDAARAIRYYLDYRRDSGWRPANSDPVFASRPSGERITRRQVWSLVKSSAHRANIDPTSIWVHCLRKSFRKVLNATPAIDEDTKEALMGHKLPGSRGSYFDYHDEDEVMAKYLQADFSNFQPGESPALPNASPERIESSN